jgi:NitT/TauT family transport system permease protein
MGIVAAQVGILVVLLLLWQFLVTPATLPYFSRPTLIGAKLLELFTHHEIYRHISVTLSEIAIGYAIGAVFGLSLGFALGRSQFLSAALQPYILGLYSVPKIALAPVFIVWLGLGMASKVAVVFIASFFLVFFNTYSGLISMNEELVRLAPHGGVLAAGHDAGDLAGGRRPGLSRAANGGTLRRHWRRHWRIYRLQRRVGLLHPLCLADL